MRHTDYELWRWPALLQAEAAPVLHIRRGSQADVLAGLRRLLTPPAAVRLPRRTLGTWLAAWGLGGRA